MSPKAEKRRQKKDANNNVVNHKFTMSSINPITDTQEDLFEAWQDDYNIAAIGTAGTGKTMCAIYLGLLDIMRSDGYESMIIVRSAVQTREQGFVPGTMEQKEALYSIPYSDIVNELFGRGDAYQIMKSKKQIKFMTTSNIRGLTFDNSIIVVDECQSMTYHELDTIITRVGENSKIIFCGDTKQDDLQQTRNRADVSGLVEFLKVINRIPSFKTVTFTPEDIVRSGLVKEYIMAKENLERQAA